MDRIDDNSSDAAKVGNFYKQLMQWIQPKKIYIKQNGSKHTEHAFVWNDKKLDLQLGLIGAGIV